MSSEMQRPLGFRFDPNDCELIGCYVKPKNFGLPLSLDIPEINNVYEHHPKDLQGGYVSENVRYCFTKRVLRGDGSQRVKRSVEGIGYWKSTSLDIDITDVNNKTVGYMRRYTFMENDDKKSSNWLMLEFRELDSENSADRYVLYKIYRGSNSPTDS